VLLHEGILEPALGITPQAVTSEKNLTYEREASAALEAVDSGAAQIAFLLNALRRGASNAHCDGRRSVAAEVHRFYPSCLSGITMYRVGWGNVISWRPPPPRFCNCTFWRTYLYPVCKCGNLRATDASF